MHRRVISYLYLCAENQEIESSEDEGSMPTEYLTGGAAGGNVAENPQPAEAENPQPVEEAGASSEPAEAPQPEAGANSEPAGAGASAEPGELAVPSEAPVPDTSPADVEV